MNKSLKILLLIVLIAVQVIIVVLMYNKWFDTLDMIKSDPNFSAENYHSRTSKKWENIIFYGSILMFITLDYFYLRKVLFPNKRLV